MPSEVAITGLGIISALGTGCQANLTALQAGSSGIGAITLFDAQGLCGAQVRTFPPLFSKRQEHRFSRASKLLFSALHEACAQSGWSLAEYQATRSGVVLGTTLGGMPAGTAFYRQFLERGWRRAHPVLSTDYLPQAQLAMAVRSCNCQGPALIVSDACASGAVALGMAAEYIQAGLADRMLAGGYDPLCWYALAGFHCLGVYSPTTCRPFDQERDGLMLGEGAALMVLEKATLAHARQANILGWWRGYAATADAYHITRPDPSGAGACRAITQALKAAECTAAQIDYINAHGTATRHNDVMEARAIERALGPQVGRIPISSSKSMVGHTLGAAGALEAVLTLLALRAGVLPPNLGLQQPDTAAQQLNIVREPHTYQGRLALSLSFGFGGQNAVIVLERAP